VLQAIHDLVDPFAVVEVQGAVKRKHTLLTYGFKDLEQKAHAVATLYDSGMISVFFFANSLEESFQVVPVFEHQQEMNAEDFERLRRVSNMTLHFLESEDILVSNRLSSKSLRRILQKYDQTARCKVDTHDESLYARIGFLFDSSFTQVVRWYSTDPVAVIQHSIAIANLMFSKQLSIRLQVGDAIVKHQVDKDFWNQERSNAMECSRDIRTLLIDVENWQRENRLNSNMAVWLLITDCFPTSDIVGLAYRSAACNIAPTNVAVSKYNGSMTWSSLAHELGHSFGVDQPVDALGRIGGSAGLPDGFIDFDSSISRDPCYDIRLARQGSKAGKIIGCLISSIAYIATGMKPEETRKVSTKEPVIPTFNPKPLSGSQGVKFLVALQETSPSQVLEKLEEQVPGLLKLAEAKIVILDSSNPFQGSLSITFVVHSFEILENSILPGNPTEPILGPILSADEIMTRLRDYPAWELLDFQVLEVDYADSDEFMESKTLPPSAPSTDMHSAYKFRFQDFAVVLSTFALTGVVISAALLLIRLHRSQLLFDPQRLTASPWSEVHQEIEMTPRHAV
jgi:hypothetical protein